MTEKEGKKGKTLSPWKKKIFLFLEAASASEIKICWVFSYNELSKYGLIKWNLCSCSIFFFFCLPQAAALHYVSGVSCCSLALRFVTFKGTAVVSLHPCALGSLAVNFKSSRSHGLSVYRQCALSLCSWSEIAVCSKCSKPGKRLLLACCPQVHGQCLEKHTSCGLCFWPLENCVTPQGIYTDSYVFSSK